MKRYLEGGDKDDCQVSGLDGGLIKVDGGKKKIMTWKLGRGEVLGEWRSPIFRHAEYEVCKTSKKKYLSELW